MCGEIKRYLIWNVDNIGETHATAQDRLYALMDKESKDKSSWSSKIWTTDIQEAIQAFYNETNIGDMEYCLCNANGKPLLRVSAGM